jgi:short-subunit dehydrogenase involved in D-alanine esterification of teichoic acids
MTNSSPFSLDGETALIAGGATGPGLAVAHSFVASGAKVVLVGRRETELEKVVAELGAKASDICHDVAQHAAANDLVAVATKTAGARG